MTIEPFATYPPVPYVWQRGNDPANDCGPACTKMLDAWIKKAITMSLAQLSAKYDPNDDGTTSNDLKLILTNEAHLTPILSNSISTNPYPYIDLVNYASLPIENRSDKVNNFLHWIVRLSDTSYHDPYWWDNTGANMSASKSVLDAASRASSSSPRVGIKERPATMATGAFARDVYGRKYLIPWTGDARWPNDPPASLELQRKLEDRRRTNGFTIGNSHDDAGLAVIRADGAKGSEVVELWGWPQAARATYNGFYAQYYPHAKVEYHEWSELNPKPPEPPTTSHPAFTTMTRAQALTGMHTINWVEDARAAYDKGCRFIVMMDNLSGAREIRDRGATVLHRTWFNDPGWTPRDCFNRLGVNAGDRLIVVGQNECDAGRCPGDIAKLQERFRWDKEFAEIVWAEAPNCFPAIGGFSVGTPMIDAGGDYAKAFRDTYAAFCNANYQRVGINWHLYVWRRVTETWKPPPEPIYQDQRWWAGRVKFFAYDPTMGGLNANVISVSDEIGGECGAGGWNWAQYNDWDGKQWWEFWSAYYGAFPQLKYAAVFIGCRSESWRGYDCRYLWDGAFRPIWQAASTQEIPPAEPASKDASPPPPLDDYIDDERDSLGRLMFDERMKQLDRPERARYR